jgi:aldehyde dehydrogenase
MPLIAKKEWGDVDDRAPKSNKIADAIEDNLRCWRRRDRRTASRCPRHCSDIPLAADHFRYFASVIQARGGISEIDKNTVAYHFHEPLGVVGEIIRSTSAADGGVEAGARRSAGNCVVLKPASPTPWSILKFAELIERSCRGRDQHRQRAGRRDRQGTRNKRIAKIAFTGETVTGRLISSTQPRTSSSTTELGGKLSNIFFADVMAEDDDFLDKAVESRSTPSTRARSAHVRHER